MIERSIKLLNIKIPSDEDKIEVEIKKYKIKIKRKEIIWQLQKHIYHH